MIEAPPQILIVHWLDLITSSFQGVSEKSRENQGLFSAAPQRLHVLIPEVFIWFIKSFWCLRAETKTTESLLQVLEAEVHCG